MHHRAQRDYLAIPLRDSVSIPHTSLSVVIVRKRFADHASHLSVGDTVVLVTQKTKTLTTPNTTTCLMWEQWLKFLISKI